MDTNKAVVGTMVGLLLYFVLSPVITGSSGYNADAGYAVLWSTVFPIGIVLGGALAIFGDKLLGKR